MKTSCTCASVSSLTRFVKGFCLSIGISTALLALSAGAAVTPITVPDAGVGPLHFDTLPGLADGWATLAIPGGNGAPNTIATMDTAALTNDVAGIITPLPTDTTGSTPTTPFIILANVRWNSVDHNLESRPTSISYNILLMALRNSSSQDQDHFNLEYDFNDLIPTGASENEDDTDLLAGFRVYYSLTGLPQSWTHVPAFDGGLATVGHRSALVTLANPWEVGANLYIMWTDDNAVNGSGGATGVIEGPLTLDNVVVNFGACLVPTITTPPHNVTVESCRETNLSVVATGTGLVYQWMHANGGAFTNLPGTDFPTLNIPIATAANAGTYKVVITNACSSTVATSPTVTLTISPDNVLPTVVGAIARADGLTYNVSFSELMDSATLLKENFTISPVAGGTVLNITNVIIAPNGTNITLQSDTPRLANVNYDLLIDPSVSDCSLNQLDANSLDVPLEFEIIIMTVENTGWTYNESGTEFPLDWITPDYDTSDPTAGWSNGLSVFDVKNTGPRTTVGGQTVMTDLILHNAAYPADDIPVYYFRGNFTMPALANVTSLSMRTFVDDFVVVWMNGDPTPVHNGLINGADPDPLRYGYSGGNAVGDAGFLGPFPVSLSSVTEGQNLVACKVFQQTNTSSDITFALELTAVIKRFVESGPRLTVSLDTGTGDVILSWPTGTGALLYQANQVDATGIGGPTGWSLVAPQADGAASVNPAGGVQKFYSLRK